MSPAMSLRHLEINIAKPQRPQLTLHLFVRRATCVAQIGILMGPAAGLWQRRTGEDLHRIRSSSANNSTAWTKGRWHIVRRASQLARFNRSSGDNQVGEIFSIAIIFAIAGMRRHAYAIQTQIA